MYDDDKKKHLSCGSRKHIVIKHLFLQVSSDVESDGRVSPDTEADVGRSQAVTCCNHAQEETTEFITGDQHSETSSVCFKPSGSAKKLESLLPSVDRFPEIVRVVFNRLVAQMFQMRP